MKNNCRLDHLVLFVLLVVSGCCTDGFKQNRVARQDQAGSSHVAVLSVAPWENYRDAVQPAFKLSSEEALALSIPNTMALEEKIVDALGAKFKVALPGTSFTETATSHAETGAATIAKQDVTKTTSSGDASKVTIGDSPAGSRTAAGLQSTSAISTPLGTDPILKYLAATALYQEVQLLNRYVKDAAIGDDVAYVVRLQVSLMPQLRDEPYDAYSTISFFSGPFEPGTGGGAPPMTATEITAQRLATDKETQAKAAIGKLPPRVKIVPLLVTDNIEAMLHSRSMDEVRQLALALSAVIQGVGVGADVQKMHEELQTVLGRDLNSSFTIARVSDNTLRYRFGALSQAQSKYAMIPQTHNVTLLVLVPKELAGDEAQNKRMVRLTAKTSFVDLATGRELPGRTGAEAHQAARDVLSKHGVKTVPNDDDVRRVLYAVADNNYSDFTNLINQIARRTEGCKLADANCPVLMNPVGYPEAVWVDMVAIRNGSQFSSASFGVPRKKAPAFVLESEVQPLVVDDGKSVCTITLVGGEGLDAQQLRASLSLRSKHLTFTATAFKVLDGGKEIQITFPSLAAYKLAGETNLPGKDLEFSFFGSGKTERFVNSTPCQYLLVPSSPKPGFAMISRAKFVSSEAGKGTVRILFSDKTETAKIRFNVDGGDVDHIESETKTLTIQEDGSGWNVSANGVVKIDLENLNPLTSIVISAVDVSNKAPHAPVVLVVSNQDVAKKAGGQ